ncbi:hypothetical protein PFICI_01004 [Pestalotiopsis fici W106-1]|uniref:Uncharacterized protein n=1 Tax=Pestalotiopsis fici (strain W106-1 / CGMCC3.15140) TaxID=1229662 RepID=W3XPJ8_PESFW|nr:uncharacterized protein PFICI_01004 [Pestalotiopsis fici W106-1]ETS87176.1 hypothetical protein PFICI_01004 [Pestalotiopsis fici W106-1]
MSNIAADLLEQLLRVAGSYNDFDVYLAVESFEITTALADHGRIVADLFRCIIVEARNHPNIDLTDDEIVALLRVSHKIRFNYTLVDAVNPEIAPEVILPTPTARWYKRARARVRNIMTPVTAERPAGPQTPATTGSGTMRTWRERPPTKTSLRMMMTTAKAAYRRRRHGRKDRDH